MNIAVITAIIGETDTIKLIPEQTVPFNRFIFTDPMPDMDDLSPRNQALYYKTNIHKLCDADYYIWVDGKIQINAPDFIEQCLAALEDNDIAILKHGERRCIYQEVSYIEQQMRRGNQYLRDRYLKRPIREQVNYYFSLGYPSNAGLNDCSIFIVRGQTMAYVFDQWWKECSEKDWFDQTSIRFLCWSAYKEISSIVFKPGSFNLVKHLK